MVFFRTQVDELFYLKDPMSTQLGHKIFTTGVQQLHDVGINTFTFKKLSTEINSVEASLYRYFSNKEQFLGYCIAYYWKQLKTILELHAAQITDIKTLLHTLAEVLDYNFAVMKDEILASNYVLLQRIAIRFTPYYHTHSMYSDQPDSMTRKVLKQYIVDVVTVLHNRLNDDDRNDANFNIMEAILLLYTHPYYLESADLKNFTMKRPQSVIMQISDIM